MAWDREAYRPTVLEPARQAGNVPTADLYQRYGLPASASDADAIAEQIDRVVAYWQALRSDRVLGPLAARLLAAHDRLIQDGPLTARRLAGLAEQNRERLRVRLAGLAAAAANEGTHAGPDTVAGLVDALGSLVTHAEVAAALRQAGVVVVDAYPELPSPHTQLNSLIEHIDQLGRQLSAELVFGDDVHRGFRVLNGFQLADGRRLDAAAVARAVRKADALPYSDRADWAQKALRIMRTAAGQAGGLDTLLLAEVVERLRRFTRHGLSGQRSVATHATGLGLAADEAGLLAAALPAEDQTTAVQQEAQEKLNGGQLRAAQRLAARLPPSDPLRARINAVHAMVLQLSQTADAAHARGETETAAEQLARAVSLAADDEALASRLAVVPPPAPGPAVAQPDGPQVLITWAPSPTRAGQVRYRVVRRLARTPVSAADGTAVVTQASECSAADPDPPTGADLYYAVFADRGAEVYSPPSTAPPLPFAPDVAGIDITEAEASITVSWPQPPAGAESVDVVRWEHRAGGDDDEGPNAGEGTAVPAGLTGFTDRGLTTGMRYRYRITVVYRAPDGALRRSGGIVVPAIPTPEPGPVTDLGTEVLADEAAVPAAQVVLRWTPPRHGQVWLVRAAHPPGWPPGDRVRVDRSTLTGIPGQSRQDGDGRAVLPARLPFGRHFVTPLTESGRIIVAGLHHGDHAGCAGPRREGHPPPRHRRAELALAGRRDPRPRAPSRRRDEVLPAGLLRRKRVQGRGGPRRGHVRHRRRARWPRRATVRPGHLGERARPAGGGALLHPPAAAAPAATSGRDFRRGHSPPAAARVRANHRPVPTRGAGRGRTDPRSRRVAGRPGKAARITVTLAHRNPGWLACFADPRADPDADPVVLIPPPANQMRVR